MVSLEVKVDRIAEMKGDKVIITSKSYAVDEQTPGEFRDEFARRQAEVGRMKDQIRAAETMLAKAKEELVKQDMRLLLKLKPKVESLMKKEFFEKQIKDLEDQIKKQESQLKPMQDLYNELTSTEMDKREVHSLKLAPKGIKVIK